MTKDQLMQTITAELADMAMEGRKVMSDISGQRVVDTSRMIDFLLDVDTRIVALDSFIRYDGRQAQV